MSWQSELVAAVQAEVIGMMSDGKIRSNTPLLFEAWKALSQPERDEYESQLGQAIRKVLPAPEPNGPNPTPRAEA